MLVTLKGQRVNRRVSVLRDGTIQHLRLRLGPS